MTTAETPNGAEIPSVVRNTMAQARQAAGSGTKFAARLKEFGVGPDDGYSESAISNWINGRVMPPADVLLAAAAIAGIPFGSGDDEPQTQAQIEQEWRTLIRLLQSQVDELRLEVRHLSGRIEIPLGPA
ncbi:MAG: helix-turn-helix domain-containing protein [Acidimicrobiia bacterium]|nr:helix-turn-helix domain-containing protein [Acidimicrobiia bacterium]